jgi:hypothetical protein
LGVFLQARHFSTRMRHAEGRARLEGELIEREMLRAKSKCAGKLRAPRFFRLIRARVDEIEAHTRKCLLRERERCERLGRRMLAPEKAQSLVGKRLHAEGQAIDARRAEAVETRCLHACRIGFESDLHIGGDVEQRGTLVKKRAHGFWFHERRRAAAEEDACDAPLSGSRAERLELTQKRRAKARVVDIPADMGIEVAIGTFRKAERPVDVDAERLTLGFPLPLGEG